MTTETGKCKIKGLNTEDFSILGKSIMDMKHKYILFLIILCMIFWCSNFAFIYFKLVNKEKIGDNSNCNKENNNDKCNKISPTWAFVQSLISSFFIVFIVIIVVVFLKITNITTFILFFYKTIIKAVVLFFSILYKFFEKKIPNNSENIKTNIKNNKSLIQSIKTDWEFYKELNEVFYNFDIFTLHPFLKNINKIHYGVGVGMILLIIIILTAIPTLISFNITTGNFLSFWVYIYTILGINIIIFILFFFPIILSLLSLNDYFKKILDKFKDDKNTNFTKLLKNCIDYYNKNTSNNSNINKGGKKK